MYFPSNDEVKTLNNDLKHIPENFLPFKLLTDFRPRHKESEQQFPNISVDSTPPQEYIGPATEEFNHREKPILSTERSDGVGKKKIHLNSQFPVQKQNNISKNSVLNSSSGYVPAAASMEIETSLEIRIPENAPLPAVVAAALDAAATELTKKVPADAEANPLDDILNNFLNQAEQSAEPEGQLHNAAEAAESADERFQSLYGTEAFMKYSVEAARLKFQEKIESIER